MNARSTRVRARAKASIPVHKSSTHLGAEFNEPLAGSIDVSAGHIARLLEVVLKVLPRRRFRKAEHEDSEIGSGFHSCDVRRRAAALAAIAALHHLHAQAAAVEIVAVAVSHCVVSVARVREGNESCGNVVFLYKLQQNAT